MSKETIERRLTAIFAADMVGYSRLMDTDETGTLDVLNLLLDQVIKPAITEHHGRIIKQMGDGILVEFASVLKAVQCSIEIQRTIAEHKEAHLGIDRIQFRIGINTGDIILQGGDVFGTGVNVAVRLESIAEPGGICLSRPVVDQVKNLLHADFVYLGEQQVKNIADPIHAFKLDLDAPAGSLVDYNSPALPARNQITTALAKRTSLWALFFVIGGFAALVIVLGIFLMFAEPPSGLPVTHTPTLTPQPRLNQTDTAVTQIIKPSSKNSLLPGVSFRDCSFCPEMVVVPTGNFLMGSDKNHEDDAPLTEVTIAKPFALSRFEITFDNWEACVKGGGCGSYIPDDNGWGRGKQPAINISWKDAQAYVVWLSERTSKTYRLPSEAEWEYAAQAGSVKRFPWGQIINPAIANYGTFNFKTLPVGSFKANAFGLYDVIGNVAEWVSDCYVKNAYNSHAHYPAPVGNLDDTCKRVLRGAHWASRSDPSKIRASTRWSGSTNGRYIFNGLRVLRVVE